LNTDRVVAEAAKMADEVAPSGLTLAGLARLRVGQPSLHKHVASLDFLQYRITTRAEGELADVLGRAAMSVSSRGGTSTSPTSSRSRTSTSSGSTR
jgi:hypothetical protein